MSHRACRHLAWSTVLAGLVLVGCEPSGPPAGPELLVYCGSSMVTPMTEVARILEAEEGVRVTIVHGGAAELYSSLARTGQGDIYAVGWPEYQARHQAQGLLGPPVVVGHNRLALIVRRGNPRGVTPDLRQLLRKDLAVVIGNPDTGAVGFEAKRVLEQAGIYPEVVANAVHLATESRNLSGVLRQGEADVVLNWRATAFLPENRGSLEAIDLDPGLALPQELTLSLVTSSRHPEAARRLMEVAAGPRGEAIFRQYGFHEGLPVAP